MNKITMNGYTRISKVEAKKRFCAGEKVLLCPCKMRPNDEHWGGSYIADLERTLEASGDLGWDETDCWEAILSNFTYYNCQYNETGKYPAFYKEV